MLWLSLEPPFSPNKVMPADNPKESIEEQEAEHDEQSAIVPKAMFKGKTKGDTCTVDIIADYGDELEIVYRDKEEKDEEPETKRDMTADEELDAMSNENYGS